MLGNIAIFLVLHNLAQGLSSFKQEEGSVPNLSQEDEYCKSLCGSSSLADCGSFGSYCKPFGPEADGVGVCQGFYHLPESDDVCFFNTNPDPTVCPENDPVFCRGATTTAEPGPTTTAEPGPTTTGEPGSTTAEPGPTTAEPGPTTTGEPGPTTAEPGPTTTAEPGPTTTGEPGPTTTGEPGPTTAEPGPTTTGEPGPTTAEPGPTTTAEPGPTTTAEPGPTTTAEPSHPGHPTGIYEGSTTIGETTVSARALFSETETILQEMNVTVSGLTIPLSNIPYEVQGQTITLTDLSNIPETYRDLIAGATLTYDQVAETITFALENLGLSLVLGRPTTRRKMGGFE